MNILVRAEGEQATSSTPLIREIFKLTLVGFSGLMIVEDGV